MRYVRILKPGDGRPRGGNPPLLPALDIELTERCNNACIHCLINQPENDAGLAAREMDTPFVKGILQQAADLGCLTVRFTGGEPLLRGDFSELYLFARRLGMRVTLFTNGRRITPEIAGLLADVPAGRDVEVTVYGMRPESYDAVAATPGAFAEFHRGLELLRFRRIPFIVKFALLPPNRRDLEAFEAFAGAVLPPGRKPAVVMHFDPRARRDDPAKNRSIEALRPTPDRALELMRRNPDYQECLTAFCARSLEPTGDRLFACGAGHGPCVDAYGRFQLCLPLRDPGTTVDLTTAGASLVSALKEFVPRLRAGRAENPEYLERCGRCFLKGLCEQCPAKSWMEHGTLDTPVERLCRIAHAQAKDLGLLSETENAWEVTDWRERIRRIAGGGHPSGGNG
jgi:MoaA/NifB/PqqE/SkfB family radical SAM enzyme